MRYRSKRIYLNTKNTKYCTVRLYADLTDMQDDYKKEGGYDFSDLRDTYGAHHAFKNLALSRDTRRWRLSPETGIIFLCVRYCGAGIVAHEILHAVLWAWKHTKNKEQYPIVIRHIHDEEGILYNLTHAIKQFYNWFWKVTEGVTKVEQKLVSSSNQTSRSWQQKQQRKPLRKNPLQKQTQR